MRGTRDIRDLLFSGPFPLGQVQKDSRFQAQNWKKKVKNFENGGDL